MDPVATLYSLAFSLKLLLRHIQGGQIDVDSISANVGQICEIVEPLRAASHSDPTVLSACGALSATLATTERHLTAWEQQRARAFGRVLAWLDNPRLARLLKQDERQLSQQLNIFLLALVAVGYLRGQTAVAVAAPAPVPPSAGEGEVQVFWRTHVGAKVDRVSASALCVALKRQFGDQLLSQHLQHALNRLEELNGGISLGDFQTLVGRVSIVNMMEEYQYLPSYSMATQSDPQLPLLVWVDDLPTNNTNEVSLALSVGVKVIQHTSTAAAIAWIEENQEFLRRNDSADRIRFITDNTRFEADPETPSAPAVVNPSAGEDVIRYLREGLYQVPILVFCSRIEDTKYVLSHKDTGSTIDPAVVQLYIRALAAGTMDDDSWKGFNIFF